MNKGGELLTAYRSTERPKEVYIRMFAFSLVFILVLKYAKNKYLNEKEKMIAQGPFN